MWPVHLGWLFPIATNQVIALLLSVTRVRAPLHQWSWSGTRAQDRQSPQAVQVSHLLWFILPLPLLLL
jgi:hypothetical protein